MKNKSDVKKVRLSDGSIGLVASPNTHGHRKLPVAWVAIDDQKVEEEDAQMTRFDWCVAVLGGLAFILLLALLQQFIPV